MKKDWISINSFSKIKHLKSLNIMLKFKITRTIHHNKQFYICYDAMWY